MKKTNPILLILAAAALALAGCSKPASDPANAAATSAMGAMTKLQKAFSPAGPDVQPSLEKIAFGIRYGQYETALPELEKLAARPDLNDAQKKAVSETTEQLKKAMAAATPKPAQ